jgi:hypothetical protein
MPHTAPPYIDRIIREVDWRFYIVFAICGFTNAVYFWAFMPETRGVPLEEIDEYFSQISVFVPASKPYIIDAGAREAELRAGRVHAPATRDIERGSEKASHSHDELKA